MKSTQSGLLSLNTSKTMHRLSMSISWKRNRMRSWSPKTSQMILTSISLLDLFYLFSIGMIVFITGWWITALSTYWKGILDIHHKLMCQENKGSFVTGTTTKNWHFMNGILSRKDTEHVMTRYLVLEYLVFVYTSARVIIIFQVGISCVIAYQVGYSSSKSLSQFTKIFQFGIGKSVKKPSPNDFVTQWTSLMTVSTHQPH